MNLPPSAAAPASPSSAPRRDWPRLLVNALVTIVVLAVAAATFVLSYTGVHAIALQGGVSVQLARVYPGVFDAVLVIACVAAVVLRDARWWARGWAWLVVIVILGAIGATDVLHASNYALRHRLTEGVVAAAPVVAVLLAFSLLLTVLRQKRPEFSDAPASPRGRAARRAARQQSAAPVDAAPIETVTLVAAGAVPRPPAPPIALPPAPADMVAEEPSAYADRAAEAPEAFPAVAETREMPAYGGDAGEAVDAGQELPAPAAAPTREEAALSTTAPAAPDTTLTPEPALTPGDTAMPEVVEALDAPEAPDAPEAADSPVAADSPSIDDPNPPTEPTEAVAAEAPSATDAAAAPDAGAAEPTADPSPQPAQAPRPTPKAIRYASSAASESAAEYWESEVDPDLAGQVYPVLTSDPDIDTSGYPDEPQDVETDAPPFGTAPFASVPRLNRMRVTPIPPTDTDAQD